LRRSDRRYRLTPPLDPCDRRSTLGAVLIAPAVSVESDLRYPLGLPVINCRFSPRIASHNCRDLRFSMLSHAAGGRICLTNCFISDNVGDVAAL
jgi:hypothetical protein